MSEIFFIAIAILGTYGLATLVADYDGPFNAFTKLRSRKVGRLFSCNVCLLPYFAALIALGLGLGLFEYLAVVGGGVILARKL